MALDLAVAHAVTRARLLEAAAHSREPWFIQVGDVRVPARRVEYSDGYEFIADFADVCSDADQAILSEGDCPRSAQRFAHPGTREFRMSWDVRLALESFAA